MHLESIEMKCLGVNNEWKSIQMPNEPWRTLCFYGTMFSNFEGSKKFIRRTDSTQGNTGVDQRDQLKHQWFKKICELHVMAWKRLENPNLSVKNHWLVFSEEFLIAPGDITQPVPLYDIFIMIAEIHASTPSLEIVEKVYKSRYSLKIDHKWALGGPEINSRVVPIDFRSSQSPCLIDFPLQCIVSSKIYNLPSGRKRGWGCVVALLNNWQSWKFQTNYVWKMFPLLILLIFPHSESV